MTTHPGQREALSDVRQRLDDLRRQRKAARDQRDTARDAFAASDYDGDVTQSPLFKRAERAVAEVRQVEADIALAEGEEQNLLRGFNGNGASGYTVGMAQSLDEQLLGELAGTTHEIRNYVRAGELVSVDDAAGLTGRYLAATTVPAGGLPASFPTGIVTPPQPPLTLLDVIPSTPQDTRVATYMRRKGGAGAAAVTQPGAVKPQSNVVYEAVDVEAEVVACYVKVNRVDVDDVPGLMADLQNGALRYDVLHAVEALLVAEITGTTGLLAPNVSGDGNVPDKLLTAVGLLTASGVVPNFIALNPTDATLAYKEREGDQNGYVAGSPWEKLPPVVQSPALPAGEALVGDSRVGAALGVRQGVTVAVGTEGSDLIQNVLTVLLEGRWAPMVLQPAALAHIDLATP